MQKLIKFWEEIWGESLSNTENHVRSFRLLNEILEKINKENDDEFIMKALSSSRSLHIVTKKLYFEYAAINRSTHKVKRLIVPLELEDLDVKSNVDFQKKIHPDYHYALENNELKLKVCQNCGAIDNFVEDEFFNKKVLVCIDDGCLQQYSFQKPGKNQKKVLVHWVGLKFTYYVGHKYDKDFNKWIKSQIEPFQQKSINESELEEVEYDETGKRVKYYYKNLKEKKNKSSNSFTKNFEDGIDVFNQDGQWYYWVLGFRTFRLNSDHKNREINDVKICSCGCM